MTSTVRIMLLFLGAIHSYGACKHQLPQLETPSFPKEIQEDALKKLSSQQSLSNLQEIFHQINLIRPVGSAELAEVKNFIIHYLENLAWSVETDTFTDDTVKGQKTFTNIIATPDPTKGRFLVLACHYESKMISGFYGSIDSAVPCSIMLEVARVLSSRLHHQRSTVGLKLIFFDGEEAFNDWSPTDSLYGSRHLAQKWHNEMGVSGESKISQLDLFVLLDLIGGMQPAIPDFQYANPHYYQLLRDLEWKARKSQLLSSTGHGGGAYFGYKTTGGVEDDHVPFMNLGVPVLHLIPVPFPPQWHKTSDDASHVDWKVAMDFLLLMKAFVVSYLHLDV